MTLGQVKAGQRISRPIERRKHCSLAICAHDRDADNCVTNARDAKSARDRAANESKRNIKEKPVRIGPETRGTEKNTTVDAMNKRDGRIKEKTKSRGGVDESANAGRRRNTRKKTRRTAESEGPRERAPCPASCPARALGGADGLLFQPVAPDRPHESHRRPCRLSPQLVPSERYSSEPVSGPASRRPSRAASSAASNVSSARAPVSRFHVAPLRSPSPAARLRPPLPIDGDIVLIEKVPYSVC